MCLKYFAVSKDRISFGFNSHEVKDSFRLLLIYQTLVLNAEGKTVLITGLFPEGSVKVGADPVFLCALCPACIRSLACVPYFS